MSADSLSSWLSGVKARLEKLTAGSTTRFADQEWVIRLRYHPWSFTQENRDEVAALLETRSADLALAVRLIEAVETILNVPEHTPASDWHPAYLDAVQEIRSALHSAFEEAQK